MGQLGGFLLAAHKGISIACADDIRQLIQEYGLEQWKLARCMVHEGLDLNIADTKQVMQAWTGMEYMDFPDPKTDSEGYTQQNEEVADALGKLI